MTEIRRLWKGALPPVPERELESLRALVGEELYEACACFWLFRYLHAAQDEERTLMGDFCFGRFSHHIARLDSVELTDAFAEYLRRDTVSGCDWDSYCDFVRGLERLL